MRLKLHNLLEQKHDNNIILLHADMWPFNTYNSINLGIQEQNMVNIASGLAYTGKKVIVYGVCGFVLYKAYEQLKLVAKRWASNHGLIIFCNAGHTGCYDFINEGHTLKDDLKLLKLLSIESVTPDHSNFTSTINNLLNKDKGIFWVRLGNDVS